MKIIMSDLQNILTIELYDFMDYHSQTDFARAINPYLASPQRYAGIIIDYKNLRFVGSSFISHVLKEMEKLNTLSPKIYFCAVGADFQKMIKIYGTGIMFEYLSKTEDALKLLLEKNEANSLSTANIQP